MPIGGKTLLQRNLAGLILDPDFAAVVSLGVVRDADQTMPGQVTPAADQAYQSVCGSLRHVKLPCPAAHGQFADGPPRVGVFVVPDGIDDGMLETLCLRSASTSAGFPCVDAYFQCLQGHQI